MFTVCLFEPTEQGIILIVSTVRVGEGLVSYLPETKWRIPWVMDRILENLITVGQVIQKQTAGQDRTGSWIHQTHLVEAECDGWERWSQDSLSNKAVLAVWPMETSKYGHSEQAMVENQWLSEPK